jgi:crotonobetainyl-CoA:carnitine CoA-transferase CaiB-like acyl-CoA transferase
VIGREDLVGDERYDSPAARAERPDEVNAMITEWTKRHTKFEAMEIIGAAGVPAGAVLDTLELYNDPTFEKRNIMQTIQHPTVGTFKMVGWPVRFSGNPPPVKPSPMLGENNEDVLSHWLGLDAGKVGALKSSGVIG